MYCTRVIIFFHIFIVIFRILFKFLDCYSTCFLLVFYIYSLTMFVYCYAPKHQGKFFVRVNPLGDKPDSDIRR